MSKVNRSGSGTGTPCFPGIPSACGKLYAGYCRRGFSFRTNFHRLGAASVSLEDQRVGIIGTGSTAVQILPAIIEEVKKVSLFQRTAQWILPQPNVPIAEEERSKFRAEPQLLQAQYDGVAQVINNVFGAALIGERMLNFTIRSRSVAGTILRPFAIRICAPG